MCQHTATIHWKKQPQDAFTNNQYSRAHQWIFDGGEQVNASSSPLVVPEPYSIAANVDPEEAFVASISSCHMLFFLSFAARKKYTIEKYTDQAFGIMNQDNQGKTAMTSVTLCPRICFSGSKIPTDEGLEQIHKLAHAHCFIANSVKTQIIINKTIIESL